MYTDVLIRLMTTASQPISLYGSAQKINPMTLLSRSNQPAVAVSVRLLESGSILAGKNRKENPGSHAPFHAETNAFFMSMLSMYLDVMFVNVGKCSIFPTSFHQFLP